MRAWCAAALLGCLAACAPDVNDAVVPTTTPALVAAISVAPTTTAAVAADLTIELFEFQSGVTVRAGQPFTISNVDGADHTMTDLDNTFESYVPARTTTTLVVDVPGIYGIWCRIHPSMRATIIVV